ncbi:MAG TPA: SUMF1/EgtB/PvdO family nonheme iron enzyme [Planctomycetota bacterium]|nr:SUMF1/EgtB/PvdO family nonheme iron enzyme [Planctomycetota bacterium]
MAEPLPEDVEDRIHELFLGGADAVERRAGLEALIAAHPALRARIESEARHLAGGDALLGVLEPPALSDVQPDAIGPYRIERKLGQGGFGTVWLGVQQEPLQRFVAIKQVRLGMDTERVLQRFAVERRALEQLDHPGIAKVLDAGRCADGRPFLALEFVDGLPLLDHCNRRGLGLEARIGLLLDIVDAVHHAHQRGILHRDLKPANLLVSELDGNARPRIIDFGLARVFDQEANDLTVEGQAVGTPEYMSPEQLRGSLDLDVRVDVHALGMVLFELLVGDLPVPRARWRSTPPSGQAELASVEPPRPSSRIPDAGLARRVRGDLDWIVLRALARDRDRRYRSAAEFGDDLRRFLRHEPVSAGPPSWLYVTRKFLRRHRLLAAASAAVLLSLAIGLVASLRLHSLADERAAAAAAHLANFDRLADALALEELTRDGERLWPAVPDRLEQLVGCKAKLETLIARLPAHQDTLGRLRARLDAGAGDQRTAFLANRLELLITALRQADAQGGLRQSLAGRVQTAGSLRQATIDAVEPAWRRAAAAVAGDARFTGLVLRPQLGLVPIGEDPDTHLQEFVHLASGAVPQRDGNGRLQPAAADGIVLVLLPGGTFRMGTQDADPNEPNHDPDAGLDSTPICDVTLAPFFMAKFEVTRSQWRRLCGSDPSFDPADPEGERPDCPVLPVTRISWHQARRAAWQWDLELPTEARWEYACRAGSTGTWPFGNEPACLQGFANIGDRTYGAEFDNDKPHTDEVDDGYVTLSPIGRFGANRFGLHDVCGNVSEHVLDQFVRYTEPCREGDGRRPVDDDKVEGRVIRGGSFTQRASRCTSGCRDGNLPDALSMWVGMRVARRLDP